MRIAVLILGLLLGAIMFLQTLLVYGLSGIAQDEASGTAAAVGLLMAFLWLIACALVLPLPLFSTVVFLGAGVAGFSVAADFPDLGIWGVVSLVLAGMSLFGWFGKRKQERREHLQEQAARATIESLQPKPVPQLICPRCGTGNAVDARFCQSCGLARGESIA